MAFKSCAGLILKSTCVADLSDKTSLSSEYYNSGFNGSYNWFYLVIRAVSHDRGTEICKPVNHLKLLDDKQTRRDQQKRM